MNWKNTKVNAILKPSRLMREGFFLFRNPQSTFRNPYALPVLVGVTSTLTLLSALVSVSIHL